MTVESKFIRATSARLGVTPIGSCRIATPLRLAQDDQGIWMNRSRSYGYCHSSSEAVQMARFLLGDFVPPRDIWPLMARSLDYDVTLATAHARADLYVVELSSAKRITIDGICVQLNYLRSVYDAFFADRVRSQRFWLAATNGVQGEMDAFLGSAWPGAAKSDDRAVLRHVRQRMSTESDLAADVGFLGDLLGRPLFVTHVNTLRQDGRPIRTRSAFIDMVSTVVNDAGLPLYNPTHRMARFGQSAAMADSDAGLAHFTEEFSSAIAADWASSLFEPAVDRLVESASLQRADEVLTNHVEQRIAVGQITGLSDRISSLEGVRPELSSLRRLSKNLRDAKRQFDQKLKKLQKQANERPSHVSTHDQLTSCALAAGDFALVVAGFNAMIGGGSLPPLPRLSNAAEVMMDAGDLAHAGLVLGLAIRHFDQPGIAAKTLAALCIDQPEIDVSPEVLARLVPHLDPLTQLKLCDQRNIPVSIAFDLVTADMLGDIAIHLGDQGELMRATGLIQQWQAVNPDVPLPTAMTGLFDAWIELFKESKSLEPHIRILTAALRILPRHAGARAAMLDVRRRLRLQTRAAVASKDLMLLDSLASQNAALSSPLAEVDLHRARLRFEIGAFAEAMAVGELAAIQLPDNISAWVLLMRAAAKLGDSVALTRFAGRVTDLSPDELGRYAIEARMHLAMKAETA